VLIILAVVALALSHRLEDPESVAASHEDRAAAGIGATPVVADARGMAEQIQ
jgi:hypothetical protein